MTLWNYGDILDAVDAFVPPQRIALIHADHVVTMARLFAAHEQLRPGAARDRTPVPATRLRSICVIARSTARVSRPRSRPV